jgi:hypothetical protein
MSKKTKANFALKFTLAALALTALSAAAIAFTGPTQDPSTAGFRSPCGYGLSKDDNCTYSQTTDSLEAISDKISAS